MVFTCIVCEHKFNQNDMDTEERMCLECMEDSNE